MNKLTEREEVDVTVIDVIHIESTLHGEERPCVGCGKNGIHNYHFISKHLHPGHQSGDINKMDIEMDKNELVKDVYFQSLCDGCVINYNLAEVNDVAKPTKAWLALESNVTYWSCNLCDKFKNCRNCGKKWDYSEWKDCQKTDVNVDFDTLICSFCLATFIPREHPIDYRRNQVLNELYGERVLPNTDE